MKLTHITEVKYRGQHAVAIQLVLRHNHEYGEVEGIGLDIEELSREIHASHINSAIENGEEISKKEGVRKINLAYDESIPNTSQFDDIERTKAIREFINRTNSPGKFYFEWAEGIDDDYWYLTFIPSFGFDNRN